MIKRVYIAGPMTRGDQILNIRKSLDAAQELIAHGFAPFVPQLAAFWHLVHPGEYESWMSLDFEWVRACHALLRLPGESAGADREEALAREIGIPVFHGIDELIINLEIRKETE